MCNFPLSRMVGHFNSFVRELVSQLNIDVSIPLDGTVFDYWLDLQAYKFKSWKDYYSKKSKPAVKERYVMLPEVS